MGSLHFALGSSKARDMPVKQSDNVPGSLEFPCPFQCPLPESVSARFTECKKKGHRGQDLAQGLRCKDWGKMLKVLQR
jgi:hypothetical protein